MSELERIRREYAKLPNRHSAAGVALLEQAVRVADAEGNVDDAWKERTELMRAVYYTGDWDKLFVAFGWCIGQHDRDPKRFPAKDLLWKYKWVMHHAAMRHEIPIARLEGLLDDLERRFRNAGSTMRAVYEQRAFALCKMGRLAEASEQVDRWRAAGRDHLSDCTACDDDEFVEAAMALGRPDEALAAAERIFAGTKKCDEVPHRTYARVLNLLHERGEHARALHLHQRGESLARPIAKLVEAHAMHIDFAARIGRDAEAVALIDLHLQNALAAPDGWSRMVFFAAVRTAMDAAASRHHDTVAIRVPQAPWGRDIPRADMVRTWADDHVRALSLAFDRRNGNDYVSRWIESGGVDCQKA